MTDHLATKQDLQLLRKDVDLLRKDTEVGFALLRKDMDTGFALVRAEFKKELAEQTTRLAYLLGGIMVTGIGVIVAAQQLFS